MFSSRPHTFGAPTKELRTFKFAITGYRLVQREGESVDEYMRKFSLAWERMCKALAPQVPPPDMMKKDRFLAGLWENLRWRVELKKTRTCEDTLEVARNKERKLRRMSQLGMDASPIKMEVRRVDPVPVQVPVEVHPSILLPSTPQVMPPVVAVTNTSDNGLKEYMRQVMDLMK